MRAWLIRVIYFLLLALGLNLYARPERYERFWSRLSHKRAHTISRLVGVLLIVISTLFVLGADVFLPR